MSISFDRLKAVSIHTKLWINGYIRECQETLFGEIVKENPYFNIPQLVNNHCILFYELFKWYKQKHGRGIKFLSDTEVVREEEETGGNPVCMIKNSVPNACCDGFDVSFKIKNTPNASELNV